jgi:hypothetical protein
MKVNREKFLEDGYLILHRVIPPDQLESLRAAYEILVERRKAICARNRGPNDSPGGEWETGAQPRLHLDHMASQIDRQTAAAVEIWLHENLQGVSSELLGVDDAAVTEMMLMCNPVRDRGPAHWHRDFRPSHSAPLQGYADDIVENGPRYVQWNLPLFDDDILWVVPGSHVRRNSDEEDEQLRRDLDAPLRSGIQTRLEAGDGVAYILPILHWGSNYSAKQRRTIHGGFSMFSQYPDLGYLERLSPEVRESFIRWDRRSEQMARTTEAALHAVIAQDRTAYHAALEKLHPGRGSMGRRQSTIYLSKTAKRIAQLKRPDFDRLPDQDRNDALTVHPMTLQWGAPFADRFSREDAEALWRRFKPVDDGLQSDEEQFSPGFQSGPSRYYFHEVPDGVDDGMLFET